MSDREAAIRALAEALQASNAHGPWEWQGGYPQRITNGAATLVADVFANPDAPPDLVAFIAACDPGTILGLLAELAAAREETKNADQQLANAITAYAELREREGKLRKALREIADGLENEHQPEPFLGIARDALADGEGET